VNRILCDSSEVDREGCAVLADHRAEHITRVLQAVPGQTLRVGIVDGPTGTATVIAVEDDAVRIKMALDGAESPRACVDLLLALPRPPILKRILPQMSALGVDRLFLTNASKVERFYFDSHVLKPDLCRVQLVEGLQQSGHTRLPRVSVHRRLKLFVEKELDESSDAEMRCLLHPGVTDRFVDALRRSDAGRVLLAVGPEGGWSDYEVTLLQAHRFQALRIGSRILRSDTACISAVALASELLPA
jgi:RsmE family RNA methyltransferase